MLGLLWMETTSLSGHHSQFGTTTWSLLQIAIQMPSLFETFYSKYRENIEEWHLKLQFAKPMTSIT